MVQQNVASILRGKKAAVFDFDGVIVQSNGIKDQAFHDIFSEHPDHFQEMWDYHKSSNATPRQEKFIHVLTNIIKDPDATQKAAQWTERFAETTQQQVIACDYVAGILDFLVYLRDHGIMTMVASATPDPQLNAIIAGRDLADHFHEVWGANLKKPEIFKNIFARHGLKPEEVLFFGDSDEDLASARKVGVDFIGIIGNSSFPGEGVPTYGDFRGIVTEL